MSLRNGKDLTQEGRWCFSWSINCSLKSNQKCFRWKRGEQDEVCQITQELNRKSVATGLMKWWIQILHFWFKSLSACTHEVKTEVQQWVSSALSKILKPFPFCILVCGAGELVKIDVIMNTDSTVRFWSTMEYSGKWCLHFFSVAAIQKTVAMQ